VRIYALRAKTAPATERERIYSTKNSLTRHKLGAHSVTPPVVCCVYVQFFPSAVCLGKIYFDTEEEVCALNRTHAIKHCAWPQIYARNNKLICAPANSKWRKHAKNPPINLRPHSFSDVSIFPFCGVAKKRCEAAGEAQCRTRRAITST
jgi:hypothetical protein